MIATTDSWGRLVLISDDGRRAAVRVLPPVLKHYEQWADVSASALWHLRERFDLGRYRRIRTTGKRAEAAAWLGVDETELTPPPQPEVAT